MTKNTTLEKVEEKPGIPAQVEIVAVRVDPELKEAVEQLFAQRGSTLSQEIRGFLRRTLKRSQGKYYCRKQIVEKVMAGFAYGGDNQVEIVHKSKRIDC